MDEISGLSGDASVDHERLAAAWNDEHDGPLTLESAYFALLLANQAIGWDHPVAKMIVTTAIRRGSAIAPGSGVGDDRLAGISMSSRVGAVSIPDVCVDCGSGEMGVCMKCSGPPIFIHSSRNDCLYHHPFRTGSVARSVTVPGDEGSGRDG